MTRRSSRSTWGPGSRTMIQPRRWDISCNRPMVTHYWSRHKLHSLSPSLKTYRVFLLPSRLVDHNIKKCFSLPEGCKDCPQSHLVLSAGPQPPPCSCVRIGSPSKSLTASIELIVCRCWKWSISNDNLVSSAESWEPLLSVSPCW